MYTFTSYELHFQQPLHVSALMGYVSSFFGVATLVTPEFALDLVNVTETRLYLEEATLTLDAPQLYLNDNVLLTSLRKSIWFKCNIQVPGAMTTTLV